MDSYNSFYPLIDENIDILVEEEITDTSLPLAKEIAWDFEHNKPVINNGRFKTVEGNEAIKVWCYKALLTPKFTHEIYSWNYGSEIESLIGTNFTKGHTESELARYIEEALIVNEYITSVYINKCSLEESKLTASITVTTIYESEVIVDV